jgi:hypothetical protein
VARTHEAALETAPTRLPVDAITEAADAAPPDGPLFVGLYGGYVRGREQGWFEVIAGKSVASFHRDGRDPNPAGRCFAFVQTVDERPRARLVDTLRRQGLRPEQPGSSSPMARRPCAACSATSSRRPSMCWTGSTSPCG